MKIENNFASESLSTNSVKSEPSNNQLLGLDIKVLNEKKERKNFFLNGEVIENIITLYLNVQDASCLERTCKAAQKLIQSHPLVHLKNYLIGNVEIINNETISKTVVYLEDLTQTKFGPPFFSYIENKSKNKKEFLLNKIVKSFGNNLDLELKIVFFVFCNFD